MQGRSERKPSARYASTISFGAGDAAAECELADEASLERRGPIDPRRFAPGGELRDGHYSRAR